VDVIDIACCLKEFVFDILVFKLIRYTYRMIFCCLSVLLSHLGMKYKIISVVMN